MRKCKSLKDLEQYTAVLNLEALFEGQDKELVKLIKKTYTSNTRLRENNQRISKEKALLKTIAQAKMVLPVKISTVTCDVFVKLLADLKTTNHTAILTYLKAIETKSAWLQKLYEIILTKDESQQKEAVLVEDQAKTIVDKVPETLK